MTPKPDSCPTDRLAGRRARAGQDRRRERRMAALEALTFAVTVASGVYFTGVLVRDLGHAEALGWAAVGAVLAAVFVAALRSYLPADVGPRPPEPEDDSDDDGGWDLANATMAAIVVPVFFVGALLVRQWPLLLVVGAMCVGATSVSGWDVAAAIACSLVLLTALEVGLVWPLSRRWDLPLD